MSLDIEQADADALKQELKRITKARKALPKDDYEGKAALSTDLKVVKKALHALENSPLNPAQESASQSFERPNFAGTYSISDRTDGWQKYVASTARSHYHDLRWREILEAVMGRQTHYLTARDKADNVIGVLPIALTRSRVFGNYGVSLPYLNYGSAIGVGKNVEDALINHAFQQADKWDLSHIEIRDTELRDGHTPRTDKVCMVLDLADIDSGDQLLLAVGSKVRAQANKALKSGISFSTGGMDLLDDYYRVFAHNMRDLGTPVYSKAFFSAILETFPEDTLLVLGRYQGKPVSAAFLLKHDDKWEIPWASTLRSANAIGANMALYATVLTTVIERGATEFDFGRSTIDAPTYKFKKQWRAQPKQLYWYYSNPDFANTLTTGNRKFELAIQAWKRLPLPVANLLGPGIVKNLP